MSVIDILSTSEVEQDPDREGIRLLLAGAASILPSSLSLDEFVMVACRMFPQLQRFDPTTVADVARRLGVA